MQVYLDLLSKVLNKGVDRLDRTGTGTKSLFGYQMRFDLQESFPLLTTKKVYFRSLVYELLSYFGQFQNVCATSNCNMSQSLLKQSRNKCLHLLVNVI